MSGHVHYHVTNRIAVLTIDNPPVNALGEGMWEAVDEAVARANADADVDALVIIGAGKTFVAGADINIFKTLKTREQSLEVSERLHGLLGRVENSVKPLVAAIHGNAFGGGLELAMACHFRVATGDARVAQPEVLLGIIPGAGGTQRLPRLCGGEFALSMCTDGKPVVAAKARAAGILDEIIDGDLLTGAGTFAKEKAVAKQVHRTRDLPITPEQAAAGLRACQQARSDLARAGRGGVARAAVVTAIEGSLTMGFDAGSAQERELFADCVVSSESKSLRHLFFAEREAAKVPDIPRDTPTLDIGRAAVIGAGTMGSGIAMCYANAGIAVLLKDIDDAALQRGLATIHKNYESTVSKGRMTREAYERTMSLIRPTTTCDDFDTVDIVAEAVFENLDLKKATLAELGRVTRPDCVLASNTSTLDIDELGKASGRPQQVVGHHFFSPANVMKLLEIVRGRETRKEVIATSIELGKRLAKVPVVVGNCFGFVANRMLVYYMREAYLLLEEGARVQQIDHALIAFGMPVGPYGMEDIAGLDVGARIRRHLESVGRAHLGGPRSTVPDRLCEMGRYGQKTGAGWYTYRAGSREPISDPIVDQIVEEEARKRGVTRAPISDDEIVSRVMTALANEGANVLHEGYAAKASDIDVIYCYGFGFPRQKGGPMFYANTIGLPIILDRVKAYRARFGDYWEPSPLLERLVAEGQGFYPDQG